MPDGSTLPVLDHHLADDELAWVNGVYRDFAAARAAFTGPAEAFNPKETLRAVLGRPFRHGPSPDKSIGPAS